SRRILRASAIIIAFAVLASGKVGAISAAPSEIHLIAMNTMVRLASLCAVVTCFEMMIRSLVSFSNGIALVMAVTLWIDFATHVPAQNPGVMTGYLKPELLVNHPGRGSPGSRSMLSIGAYQDLHQRMLADPATDYLCRR